MLVPGLTQRAWWRRWHSRAVADGPVGPAMAGPIIDPVIFIFLIFFFFNLFSDRTNNRASHFDFRNLC